MTFDLWSSTSFAVEALGLETDPWSRPMGRDGLVVIPDKFNPTLAVKISPTAERALTWIISFFDEVGWIRPRLTAENIEDFLMYHHHWFHRGSPNYRHYVLKVPLPKFSDANDMTRLELEGLQPWKDPYDPDNRKKAQVNVVVNDLEEDNHKTPPPNHLRKTTVKDIKVWPMDLDRSESDTIDLTKADGAEDTGIDEESENVDIVTLKPAKTESMLTFIFLISLKQISLSN